MSEQKRQRSYSSARAKLEEFLANYSFSTDDLLGEIWYILGDYAASNFARVKTFKRGRSKILKPRLSDSGHLYVVFSQDGQLKHFFLRKLVAQLFVPNPEGFSEIRFIDGDKFNCRADNLLWTNGRSDREYKFFDGRRFFCDEKGYWKSTDREGKFLHVAIWEAAHGKVPKGYHIHHIDLNPANNALENLQLLSMSEHMSLHAKLRAKLPKSYNKPRVCTFCGKTFMASRSDAKFCSANCQVRWRYHQGLCHTKRICAHCGAEFLAVNPRTRYCSMQCAAKANGTAKLTDDQRQEILRRHNEDGLSQRALAKMFGVDRKTIWNIINGK